MEHYIEALIFASEQGIRMEEIMYCLQAAFERDFTSEEVSEGIAAIQNKYNHDKWKILYQLA